MNGRIGADRTATSGRGVVACRAAACVVGACVAVLGAPAVASAEPAGSPVTTGCSGGELLSVRALIAEDRDYRPVRAIDANGDGFVCGRALPASAGEQVCADCGVPVVYLFTDNQLRPEG